MESVILLFPESEVLDWEEFLQAGVYKIHPKSEGYKQVSILLSLTL
jgi:hypothetical protein